MWKQNIHNCWNCVRLTTITLANMELEELENRVNALSIRREKLEQKVGSRPILSCVSSSFRVRWGFPALLLSIYDENPCFSWMHAANIPSIYQASTVSSLIIYFFIIFTCENSSSFAHPLWRNFLPFVKRKSKRSLIDWRFRIVRPRNVTWRSWEMSVRNCISIRNCV